MWWSASGHLGIWEFGNFTRLAFERFDGRAGAARMSVVVVVVVVVMVVVMVVVLTVLLFLVVVELTFLVAVATTI